MSKKKTIMYTHIQQEGVYEKAPTRTSKMSRNSKIRGRGESGDRRKEERGVNERKHVQAKAKSVNWLILTDRKGNLKKKTKTVNKGKKRSAHEDKIGTCKGCPAWCLYCLYNAGNIW